MVHSIGWERQDCYKTARDTEVRIYFLSGGRLLSEGGFIFDTVEFVSPHDWPECVGSDWHSSLEVDSVKSRYHRDEGQKTAFVETVYFGQYLRGKLWARNRGVRSRLLAGRLLWHIPTIIADSSLQARGTSVGVPY